MLAGDHVYKMDYGPMIAFHKEKGADITIGGVQVPDRAGARVRRDDGRTTPSASSASTRSPRDPEPMPGRDDVALASMGIYVFSREFLQGDARARRRPIPTRRTTSAATSFPGNVASRRVFAYPFEDVETKAQAYWRDVGTVDAYYDANMELIYVSPELNLYDEAWPIWTYQEQVPWAKFMLDEDGRRGLAINSMIAGGCIISGATVRESLLFSNSLVDERSQVRRSVLLPQVRDRAQLSHHPRDHRRRLHHSAGTEIGAIRRRRAPLSRHRSRRRARDAGHAGRSGCPAQPHRQVRRAG